MAAVQDAPEEEIAQTERTTSPDGLGDPFLWLVLGLSLVVRMLYLLWFARTPLAGYLRADQKYYFQWAVQIANGDWIGQQVFEQAPLYPYLLGTSIRLISGHLLVLLALQLLTGVFSCGLIFGAGKRLFGRKAGLAGGLLLAVYGPVVFYEGMILKSFLSPLLTTMAFYSAVRYRDSENTAWIWLSGMSVGLACLVRENHALLLPPLALFVLLCVRTKSDTGSTGLLTRLRPVLHLGFASALMLVPSAVRNYHVAKEFVPVTAGGGEVFYLAFGENAGGYYSAPSFVTGNPFLEHEDFRKEAAKRLGRDVTRAESSRFWYNVALKQATEDPSRTLDLTLKKADCLFNDYEVADGENFRVTAKFVRLLNVLPTFGWIGGLGACGALLCLVGAAGRLRAVAVSGDESTSPSRGGWIVPAMAASHVFTVLLLYNFGRFRLGMMPLWCLMAGVCLVWIVEGLRKPSLFRIASRGVIIAAAVTISFVMLQPSRVGIPRGHRASDALITADLALRSGQTDLAISELKRVPELYAEFSPNNPKVARLLTRAYFYLGQTYDSRKEWDLAAKEFQRALALPNRKDFRTILLTEWTRFLKDAIKAGRNVPGVESLPDALSTAEDELATLRPDNESAVAAT